MRFKSVSLAVVLSLLLFPGVQMVWSENPENPLYKEEFEKGTAQDWNLGKGWSVVQLQGHYCLKGDGPATGTDGSVASLRKGSEWTDYVVGVGVQLMKGGLNISVRRGPKGRYFVEFTDRSVKICKTIRDKEALRALQVSTTPSEDQPWAEKTPNEAHVFNLALADPGLIPGKWHQVHVAVAGNQIVAYVDGEPKVQYADPEPMSSGSIELEVWEKSSALFGELQVNSLVGK
jgi:hypothetical protein